MQTVGIEGTAKPRSAGRWRHVPLILRLLVLALFVAGVVDLHRRFDILHHLAPSRIEATIATIRGELARFGAFGPAVYVVACAVAMLVNLPTATCIYLSVILFGPWWGGAASVAIISLGMSAMYAAAQALGRPVVVALFGQRLARAERRVFQSELLTVANARLLFFMNPATNWLLCVSGIRYRNLIAGTLLGAGPAIALNVWLVGVFMDLYKSGRSLNPLRSPQLLAPLLAGWAIYLVVRVLRRRPAPAAAAAGAGRKAEG